MKNFIAAVKEEEAGPPNFTKKLEDIAVPDGEKATLQVEIAGKPKEVKWYKNGKEIKDNKRMKIEALDDRTFRLVIGSVSKEDQADYKVVATNEFGTADSEASLTIKGAPPKFIRPLADKTVASWTKLVLEIELEKKPKSVKWFRNGKELKSGNRMEITESEDGKTFRVVIPEVNMEDMGKYAVQASNDFGSTATEAIITVEDAIMERGEAPSIIRGLQNESVLEGQDVMLIAEIAGKPKEIKWYKNGRTVKSSNQVKIEKLDDRTFRLVIGGATKEDEGDYKIEAINDVGTAASEAHLTVGKAKIRKKIQKLSLTKFRQNFQN